PADPAGRSLPAGSTTPHAEPVPLRCCNPPALKLVAMEQVEPTLYDAAGGMEFFERLVDTFYDGVEQDDVLAPLYPEAPDFSGARRRLRLFLAQYWGGPGTYSSERGHPRLRMRHFPFPVGPRQRDRWLFHMTNAVESLTAEGPIRQALLDYFVMAADQMMNSHD
ncbi:MAG TPA: globin, partial [Acidimicrobiales bacterium]|nr:globin [Acidimicrobiales bacterium]